MPRAKPVLAGNQHLTKDEKKKDWKEKMQLDLGLMVFTRQLG